MFLKILASAALSVVLSAAPFAYAAFKWVDKDGRVHYSDREPPDGESNVEEKSFQPSSNLGPALSYEQEQAVKFYPITVYTIAECRSECSSGREFLSRRKIPYTEKVINPSEDASAFTKQTGIDKIIAPVMKLGSKIVKGYDELLWKNALIETGYIKAGAPVPPPAPAAPNRATLPPSAGGGALDSAPAATPEGTPSQDGAASQRDAAPVNPTGK